MKQYPEYFSTFTTSIVFYYIGIQLMTYDHLGALFAKLIAENDHSISLLMTPLLCKPRTNMVKRYVTWRAAMGLITGKGTMTSTGRATIIVGVMTSVTFLGDSVIKHAAEARARQEAREEAARARQQASEEAAKNRAYEWAKLQVKLEATRRAREEACKEAARTRQEAAKAREYEIYKAHHATWQNASWGNRGPEPTWEEKKKK
jgi:hypothetical protein